MWLPYWLPFAATAALPLCHVVARVRRSRRLRLNLCPTCGYDLRATPERCPECGAVPADS
jgi:rubrerythrin